MPVQPLKTIAMVGLGRMGANMVRRLMKGGIQCVVYDLNPASVGALVSDGAIGAQSLSDLVDKLGERSKTKAIWIMVPAAFVAATVESISALLGAGDIIIDGGNSYFRDDLTMTENLLPKGIDYLDVGTSGGVLGLERGYCLMVGGKQSSVEALSEVFGALSPGIQAAPRTHEGPISKGEQGWLHCGPSGAGHFTKMVHNGIEYAMMAAYAEGLNILSRAGLGNAELERDAETAPLRDPSAYMYDFDIAATSELWRRGSVISSFLLDLTANALHESPNLDEFAGRVSDSGEGRWTVQAGVDLGVPTPVISASLYSRFASQNNDLIANKTLAAMRKQFGGHNEKPADTK